MDNPDAEVAKPSGWLGVLGVGNPDSIAVLAGTATLRKAELKLHHPMTLFAALRAP